LRRASARDPLSRKQDFTWMNSNAQSRLLTVGEVALKLRQSPRSVRDKIAAGEIPAVRIGSGPKAPIRVDAAELERWLFSAGASPPEDEVA
jgi:excisionase family DNA binding protein